MKLVKNFFHSAFLVYQKWAKYNSPSGNVTCALKTSYSVVVVPHVYTYTIND